jgi:multicomponent Na+:H+ antiporter subunit D
MAGAAAAAAPTSVRLVVAALILAAFGMKLGLFPFHYWLPAVYRETRPAVAALFAGPLAAIGGYGLLRFGGELFYDVLDDARGALLVLGGASVLYGGLVAIHRPVLRDVIAYSSISQAGLLVLALSIGGPGGFAAATLNSLTNALHKTCLFLAVGSSGNGRSTALMVAGLSVAGLPPLVGFAGKVALLRAAVADANAAAVALVALGSALSYVYVARAWRSFRPLRREPAPAPSRTTSPLLLGVLLAAILGLGAWPATVVGWSEQAAACVGVSK